MILAAILVPLGVGFLCRVLLSLAAYALPAYVAVSVGLWANASGSGPVIAIAVAFVAGALTLVLGQVAFATIRSAPLRLALAVTFALPAGVAGFHALKRLAELGDVSEPWTTVVALVGSLAVGSTAWMRLAALAEGDEPCRARAAVRTARQAIAAEGAVGHTETRFGAFAWTKAWPADPLAEHRARHSFSASFGCDSLRVPDPGTLGS